MENERKKDIQTNKDFTENRTQQLYDQLQGQIDERNNDFDKKIQQFKFEITESTMENADVQRKDLKNFKYIIEKNAEDIEYLQNDIKNLKKHSQEHSSSVTSLIKENPNVTSSQIENIDSKMNNKIDSQLKNLHEQITDQYEDYVTQTVSHNNHEFVVPKMHDIVEKQLNERMMQPTPSIEDIQRHTVSDEDIEQTWVNVMHRDINPLIQKIVEENVESSVQEYIDNEVPKLCKLIIDDQVPQIWKRVMEDELEIACHSLIESNIEPTWRHILIEEYARNRRNIIEKEIEPTWKQIIEEEVPQLCNDAMKVEYNNVRQAVIKDEIRPAWIDVVNEEVPQAIKDSMQHELLKSRQQIIYEEVEPVWKNIIANEIDSKIRNIIHGELEGTTKEIVKEELDSRSVSYNHESVEHLNSIRPSIISAHSKPKIDSNTYLQSSPVMVHSLDKVQSKSAKQLPKRFSRIEESDEEDSPANLPRHNIPPESFVNSRNSALASEVSNVDNRSIEDMNMKFSGDPYYQARIHTFNSSKGDSQMCLLRESKQDRLHGFLKERFRPNSSNSRSASKRSIRSNSSSKNYLTPDYKPNMYQKAVTFGLSDARNDSSIGNFHDQSSYNGTEGHQKRSFTAPGTRAREILRQNDSMFEETKL